MRREVRRRDVLGKSVRQMLLPSRPSQRVRAGTTVREFDQPAGDSVSVSKIPLSAGTSDTIRSASAAGKSAQAMAL